MNGTGKKIHEDCPRPPAADPVDPWEALNIHIIPTKVARVVPEEAITVTRRMPPVSCPGLGSVGSETSAELFPCRKLELRIPKKDSEEDDSPTWDAEDDGAGTPGRRMSRDGPKGSRRRSSGLGWAERDRTYANDAELALDGGAGLLTPRDVGRASGGVAVAVSRMARIFESMMSYEHPPARECHL